MKLQIGNIVKLSPKKVGLYDEYATYRGIVIDIVKKTYTIRWLNNGETYDGYTMDELRKVC